MTVDLSLIFLNYNTPDWISLALKTLQRHYLQKTKLSVEVLVVDNASTDNSVAVIQRHFPWVKLIQSPTNAGFAAGNNLALRQATGRYLMLLNSDLEFAADAELDQLVYYLEAHPEIGVITPKVKLADGRLDPASHRGEPTVWASFTYFTGLAKRFPQSRLWAQYHQTYQSFDQIHFIDACSGAAMMVRRRAMEDVGLLDEQFFMYAEDLDWCKRFRTAGYQICYFPGVTVTHHKYKSGRGKTNAALAEQTNRHFYQTMLQYFDKHYRTASPFWVRWLIQGFVWYKTKNT